MGKDLTKADRVMRLHARGLRTRDIVLAVYGQYTAARAAYVRVVRNQRKGGRRSEIDKRYMDNGGRTIRHRRHRERHTTDPDYRARKSANARAWQLANPEKFKLIRDAYRARKKSSCDNAANHP